jgi:hypothetical protein
MTLDELRKKVIYQNTLDVWISACEESGINWSEAGHYKKFIEYLQNQNINMKKFPLCVSESDNSSPEKVSFAEHLSESKDPNHATFTIKLSDSTIEAIRKFDFKN